MPAVTQPAFPQLLKTFSKKITTTRKANKPGLVLIIMANTHDKVLSRECKKDMKAVKNGFKKISRHFKIDLNTIEVAGTHYGWDNLDKAIDCTRIPMLKTDGNSDDTIIFYYTGHGFSYEKDRYTKYPQLDMRPHNKQVKYDNINFIKDNTVNLEALLNILRFKGNRVNIAIADCCNTTIPYKRPKANFHDMWVSGQILPTKSNTLTKEIYTNDDKEVSILIGSSQFGQPAVADPKMGSIFTHFFIKALMAVTATKPKGEAYIPWVKIFKKVTAQAFKESKGYDIGGGVAGKQKAVFQVYAGKGL
jgi:Caspase domain